MRGEVDFDKENEL